MQLILPMLRLFRKGIYLSHDIMVPCPLWQTLCDLALKLEVKGTQDYTEWLKTLPCRLKLLALCFAFASAKSFPG